MTDVKNALDLMSTEMEIEMAADELRSASEGSTKGKQEEAVSNRPVHRLEGIRSMQQRTLEQAISHRKEFEVTKEKNLEDMEAAFRRHIDTCDAKIAQVTETLGLLQKEKMDLYAAMEKRRQEIVEQFKADEAALVKIINAQRGVIDALGDDHADELAPRPNGSRKPDRGDNKRQETSQEEQRPN
jgi:hypothetical protein